MFIKSSLVFLAFAASAIASPLRRAESLVVQVKPASGSVSSIEDLKFTASVTNTGSEPVKILKYGTILDEKLPTKSFVVTKDGSNVPFTGIKLSVSLSDVDESAFAVIGAGETLTVSHSPASLYDFASVGSGKFAFTPVTNFLVEDEAAKVVSAGGNLARIEVAAQPVEVEISGDLEGRELAALEPRARDICTTTSRASFIDASFSEAKTLASTASSYIGSHGADSLYTSYFGTNPTSSVTRILNAVSGENSSSRTLSCTDTYGGCSSGVIAYTVISTTNIYFCSIFFNEVATSNLCSGTTVASRNARGGTTLHELTHAVGGTDDVTYGCAADQALSTSNKLANADNFNCFTTQVYQNTRC